MPFPWPPLPAWTRRLLANKHFRYGVPFMSLIVGAPLVLKDLYQVRIDAKRAKLVQDQFKEAGITFTEVDEEKVLEKYVKEVEDDYEMIRGPR